MQIIQTLRTTC